MMAAVKEFLRDCVRLLYWVFFKPTALRAHLEQVAPGISDKQKPLDWLREVWRNAALRRFLLQALIITIVTPFLLSFVSWLIAIVISGIFNWARSLRSVANDAARGVAIGVAFGVIVCTVTVFRFSDETAYKPSHKQLGVASIVAGIVAFGVAIGVAAGVAGNFIAIGIAFCIAVGVLRGVYCGVEKSADFGVLLNLPWALIGVIGSVSVGIEKSADYSWVARVVVGIALGLAFLVEIAFVAGSGALRLIFYIFEIWPAVAAHRRSQSSNTPDIELSRSPVYYDELLVLPQPYLSSLLLRVARNDLDAGLRHLARVACNPFQRWAAQRALRTLLEQDQIPFSLIIDRLLASPEPYIQTGNTSEEYARGVDRYFTSKLLLAELMDEWPEPKQNADWYWPLDFLARLMTFRLRKRGQSPYEPPAEFYFMLMYGGIVSLRHYFKKKGGPISLSSTIEDFHPWTKATSENLRDLPHGEEIFQSLRIVDAALSCESLQDITQLRDEFNPLFKIIAPLWPQIISVCRYLREASIGITDFLSSTYEISRGDALLRALGALDFDAKRLLGKFNEPERSLIDEVIEKWRSLIIEEGRQIAQRLDVRILPNPYIAGRPIHPEDGKLFVGRRDVFLRIEEKLQTGVGVVIYGQRRIGKTSILLHLRERLPHHILPVYLNLQSLMANTTGGFLWAVGNEAVKELRGKLLITLTPHSAEEFIREPYLSFNRLLEEIERQLQPEQRLLLSFDEFEELEQRVKAGKIEKEIFAYLRGITQTGRRFAMLFAGLHTLEQMTREYWNPFFQSIQTIRIGYLGELDARQLISDPIDQFPLGYDEEAIDRITEVTNAHPYLAQSVCHNLVNRLNDPLYRSNRATAEDVNAVLEKTLESSGYYFDDYVWGWSNADERLALALIAEAGDEADFAVVEKHLGREAALMATQNLIARDIISEHTERNDLIFRFRIPLSRMWVRWTKSSARILLERRSD